MTDIEDLLRRLKHDADRSLTVTLNRRSALALVNEIERLRELHDPPAIDYRQRIPRRTTQPATIMPQQPSRQRSGQVFWPAILVAAVVFLAYLVQANTRELHAASQAAPALAPRMYLEQLDAAGAVEVRREVTQFTFADGSTADAAQLFAAAEWSTPPATSIAIEVSSNLRIVCALR